MGYLDNLAKSLIGTTLMPSQETKGSAALSGAVTQFGKEFQKELEPFRMQKKSDIITHEYAADPYRLDLTKKFAAIGGNKSWGILAGELEEARDAVLNYKKQVATKIVKEPIATDVAPKVFQLGDLEKKETKKIGNYIVGRRSDDRYIYKKVGDEGYAVDNKLGTKIKKLGILESAPVVRPKVKKTVERQKDFKTLDELEHNLKVLEKKFNSIVPGRSEIEKLYQTQLQLFGATSKDKGKGKGKKKLSDKYVLQYKEYMDQVETLRTRMQGMGLMESPKGAVIISALRDWGATMEEKDMEDGKAFTLFNTTFKEMESLNMSTIDSLFNANDKKVKARAKEINNSKVSETEKEMARYLLLTEMAGYGLSGNAVVNGLSERALVSGFVNAGANMNTFIGGREKQKKFFGDFSVMTDFYLRKNVGSEYAETIRKKGESKFNKYAYDLGVKKERLGLGGQIDPDDLQERLRDKLGDWAKYRKTSLYKRLKRYAHIGE